MANQWYVQHAGKQYGPLTSANLKKLADDGKILPTTSVRLGEAGAWGPASRVQGLFNSAPSGPPPAQVKAAGAPRAATPQGTAPQAAKLARPPVVPPQAPLTAAPLTAMPLARPLTPIAQSTAPQDNTSMPALILGAVALVLGLLALATCWLAWMGAIGWLGIVAGGLGLVLGIVGFVFSALNKGSGLHLNIGGTSSSVVGLVLSIVFGVQFGLFKGAPPAAPPPVAILTPKIEPAPPPPPVEEPQAEPEPEIVWTDASQPIMLGNVQASIQTATIENIRLENTDPTSLKRQASKPMLKIRVVIENTSNDKIIPFAGWGGGADLASQGAGLLGGEAGEALKAATATAKLTDNHGNAYPQTPSFLLGSGTIAIGKDNSVRPGQKGQSDLIYPPPLATIEYLRIELPGVAIGASEPLRFQIPRSMIVGMPTAPATTP